MDVSSFSSLPAHVNDREAQDEAVTRVRSKKQHKRALVRIHSMKPNPYSRLTNNTVHGGTFRPKGNEQRLLECEIKVMELTSEIRKLKQELGIISPDKSHTVTSSTKDTESSTDTLPSTATPGQGITSSNPMDKPTLAKSGSSAVPTESSHTRAEPIRLTATSSHHASPSASQTTPSLLTSSEQQQTTSLTGKPASAAVSPSSLLPTSSSGAVVEPVSSSAPTVTPSTYNSSRTGHEATSSHPATGSSQSIAVPENEISNIAGSPTRSTGASVTAHLHSSATKNQTDVSLPAPTVQPELTSSSLTAKSTSTEGSLSTVIPSGVSPSVSAKANLTETSSSPLAVSTDSAKVLSSTALIDASTPSGLSGTTSTIASHQQGVTSSADKKSSKKAFESSSIPASLSSLGAVASIPLVSPFNTVGTSFSGLSRLSSSNHQHAAPTDTTEKVTLATVAQAAVTPTVTLKKFASSASGSASSMVLPSTLSSLSSATARLLTSSRPVAPVSQNTASSTLLVAAETSTGSGAFSPAVSLYTTADVNPAFSLQATASDRPDSVMATSSGRQTELASSTTTPSRATSSLDGVLPFATTADTSASASASILPEILANATAIASMTTASTATQVPLTPTTALPPLKTLLADAAGSTLIGGLKRTLVEYKKQNHTADVSGMTSSLDELVAYYEAVSLITGISAFIRSIKDSFPDVAQIYDERLKKFTDDIKGISGQGKKSDRLRRAPVADMVKLLLNDLYAFEKAPMNLQMREFFQGFEQDRDLFAQIMTEQISELPADFQELFNNMKSGASIISAMDAYNTQIKDLVAKGDFAEVGKIALKVNICRSAGQERGIGRQ